ncbi:hypothetical protein H2200_001746 [Cladophialophora chaetospira]|uniref:Clr5 domain-containing protein n=1 Tax=Cladophialophora chaetospira TaxID=386627 RepID=A0AA39CPY4_9EURO|nr:hypothetical protein H2200_001746 [Cladophialophora chaetospira]
MRQEYGFDATDKMYKSRLRNWNMRKNYTKQLKEESIRRLTLEASEPNPDLLLDPCGRPLLLHRLWRPVQCRGQRRCLIDRTKRSGLQQGHQTSRQSPNHLHLRTSLIVDNQGSELLLSYAQNYYSWYKSEVDSEMRYFYTPELADVFNPLTSARYDLSTDPIRAFQLLNSCCSGFQVLLKLQPFQLLQHLLGELAAGALVWQIHRQIRTLLLDFFAALAIKMLGENHPIAKIIGLLVAIESEEVVHLSSIFAALLEDNAKSIANKQASLMVQLSVVQLTKAVQGLDAAWVLCERMWTAVQPISTPPSHVQLTTLEALSTISIRREDYSTTEKLLKMRTRWSVDATGRPNGDSGGIYACIDLGLMYYRLGRINESEEHYLLALEGALECEEVAEAWMLLTIDHLEDCFRRMGKQELLAQLKRQIFFFRLAVDGALQYKDGLREDELMIFADSRLFVEEYGREEELAQLQNKFGYVWAEELDEWTLRPSSLETNHD